MKSEKHESDRPIKPMKRRAAEWTEYNLAVPPHKKEKMSSELDSGISSKTELHLEHNHDSDEFAKQKDDEVRTLFVSGLPHDIKPREFQLLLYQYQGYEGAIIKHPSPVTVRPTKGGPSSQLPFQMMQEKILGPVAFLTFATRAEAEQARAAFQGFQMDPELDIHLKLEFAKTNTKSKYRSRDAQQQQQQQATTSSYNEPILQTIPALQPQFSTPVAIDPALVQNDIYARNLCWPMCVQMACPTGEQLSYAEAYAPLHVDGLTALQPILLPTDQFVHPNNRTMN